MQRKHAMNKSKKCGYWNGEVKKNAGDFLAIRGRKGSKREIISLLFSHINL